MENKTLDEMKAEVRAWTIRKGWRENPDVPERTFGDDMALLTSEVSEAIEAYRSHGFKAWIDLGAFEGGIVELTDAEPDYQGYKPEGVGSELADILIRMLDNYAEQGLTPEIYGEFPISNRLESFGDQMSFLSLLISNTFASWMQYPYSERYGYFFNNIITALFKIAEANNINIYHEYEAKMEYNETREHRHGNKKL